MSSVKSLLINAVKLPLFILAFTPLVVDESVFFPFITGKSLLVRIMVTLTAVFFVAYLTYSNQFRQEIFQKIKNIFKNPLLISVCAFIFVFSVSAVFAVNQYRAFFGDVERGEGLVGVLFFFGFFIFSLLIFDKKDWLWFFKLSLVVGFILFIKALFQFLGGSSRPESYIGNPAFLAGYFLFTILSAAIILYQHKPDKSAKININWRFPLWFWFSGLMTILAILGIFLTQTRGTILGLIAGFIAVAVYSAIFGKEIFIRRLNIQKLSIGLLILITVFSAAFWLTRGAEIWQKIPGLARVAQIGPGDSTFETRRIIAGMVPEMIRPSADFQKFLIGWGPENFGIAFNRYFDPAHYKWERAWFDRSHNKLIDVLIMNGILGLLAYLAIWFSFLYLIFKKSKEFSFESAGLLFFGVGLFVHNLIVFDQISTYIPFFGALAFLIFKSSPEQNNDAITSRNNIIASPAESGIKSAKQSQKDCRAASFLAPQNYFAGLAMTTSSFFGILALFYLISLFFWTLPAYFQMREYLKAVSSGNASVLSKSFDSATSYYTYAQENIRTQFLSVIVGNYQKSPVMQNLFDKATTKMDELLEKEPYNARYFILMAEAFRVKAKIDGDFTFYQRAESYLRKSLALAPQRPDVNYVLAVTLAEQGKFSEAQEILEKILKLDKEISDTYYYLGLVKFLEGQEHYAEALKYLENFLNSPRIMMDQTASLAALYNSFFEYFYRQKDQPRAIIAVNRLIQLKPEKKEDLEKILEYFRQNQWPEIDFK